MLPPAEEPSIAPTPVAVAEFVGSPRPSPGWDAVDLRAAPLMSSLARSGTVDRGRAQRARYLGDEYEPRTGRSRSVSRSRSRSPSPAARLDGRSRPMFPPESDFPDHDPFALWRDDRTNGEKLVAEFGLSRGDARFEPSWSRAPTNGENIAAELFLRRAANDIFSIEKAKAVIDPKTYESLMKLVEATVPESWIHLDGHHVSTLASGMGPETMPAAHLADIVHAVRHEDAVKEARSIHRSLSFQINMWSYRKVTFGELAEKAEYFEKNDVRAHAALRRLAVKVGNKHSEIGLDTKIDVEVLAAGTGPETMSLLTLVILLTGIPGFVVIVPTLQALFSGDNPFWNMLSIPLGGICFGLAKKRVGE